MEKVKGYHEMMSNIRGIRGVKDSRIQKGDTVYQTFFKGKEKLAMAIISLINPKLNEYYAKVKV